MLSKVTSLCTLFWLKYCITQKSCFIYRLTFVIFTGNSNFCIILYKPHVGLDVQKCKGGLTENGYKSSNLMTTCICRDNVLIIGKICTFVCGRWTATCSRMHGNRDFPSLTFMEVHMTVDVRDCAEIFLAVNTSECGASIRHNYRSTRILPLDRPPNNIQSTHTQTIIYFPSRDKRRECNNSEQ